MTSDHSGLELVVRNRTGRVTRSTPLGFATSPSPTPRLSKVNWCPAPELWVAQWLTQAKFSCMLLHPWASVASAGLAREDGKEQSSLFCFSSLSGP